MISQLALLALAGAVVEYDFRVSNSYDLAAAGKNVEHGNHLSRRAAHEHKGGKSKNDTVAPVINATLSSSYNFYYGDLLVGQPPQKLEVLLDTGSPVSWLYGPQGSYKNASRFFPNKSITYEADNTSFSAEYGSGIYLGHWGSDLVAAPQFVASNLTHNVTYNFTGNHSANYTSNFTYNGTIYNLTWDITNSTLINATAFNNSAFNASLFHNSSAGSNRTNISILPFSVPFQFGLVSSYQTAAGAPGLLGLGPHIEGAGPKGYLSLPEAYKRYNVTTSSAFSVFLEKDKGRFLFGGADLKYAQLPFYRYSPSQYFKNETDAPTAWTVTLDSVAYKGKYNYSINNTATLDTGSPVSLVPGEIVEKLGKALKLKKNEKYNAYYSKDGKLPKGEVEISINGGLVISAEISSLFVPGHYIWLDDGPKNVSALGLLGSTSYLLGDAFFRNTYTVLDPSNGDVLVAKRSKALLNSTNSTNATTVVPIDKLLKNRTAVIDVAAHIKPKNSSKTTSKKGVSEFKTATNVDNAYVGTVDAARAAGVQADASGSATKKSEKKSSSTKSKNGAATNGASMTLLAAAAAPFLLLL